MWLNTNSFLVCSFALLFTSRRPSVSTHSGNAFLPNQVELVLHARPNPLHKMQGQKAPPFYNVMALLGTWHQCCLTMHISLPHPPQSCKAGWGTMRCQTTLGWARMGKENVQHSTVLIPLPCLTLLRQEEGENSVACLKNNRGMLRLGCNPTLVLLLNRQPHCSTWELRVETRGCDQQPVWGPWD